MKPSDVQVELVTDDQIRARTKAVYETSGYVLCPHSATTFEAWWRLPEAVRSERDWIALATAHPYKFDAVLEDILAAKRTVHFETYLWKDGRIGRRMADAFSKQARAGVKVRLVLDAVGCKKIGKEVRDGMLAVTGLLNRAVGGKGFTAFRISDARWIPYRS